GLTGLRRRAGAADPDVHQQRAILAGVDRGDPARAAELGLETGDQLDEVGSRLRGGLGGQLAPWPSGGGVRHQVADIQFASTTRGIDGNRRYSIQPQQCEVGEVVAGERLAAQVGVDQAKPAESALSAAHTTDIGQHDLRRVADERVLDRTAAVDQHTDLSVELCALCSELRSELARHHLGRRDAPPVQTLQRLDLARLEPGEISCHLFVQVVVTFLYAIARGIYPLHAGLPPI
ncbi:MAG TPA: hypothetical protein VF516_46860, partial [Kofleriaceae bacterium]